MVVRKKGERAQTESVSVGILKLMGAALGSGGCLAVNSMAGDEGMRG